MKISLCITSFNRSAMTMESFAKVHDYDLIDEVIIVDDASDMKHYNELYRLIYFSEYKVKHKDLETWKIKLFRNDENLGMSRNKREAISKAKNEWVILFDSDNILYPEYLDAVEKCWLNPIETDVSIRGGGKVIYHPDFAEPEHDYRQFEGLVIDKLNAKHHLHKAEFRCLLNSSNYVVNRDEYLRVYKYNPDIQEADTIWMNTQWLKAGNAFYIVPGMRYLHKKHSDSGWLKGDRRKNMKDAKNLQKEIRFMK